MYGKNVGAYTLLIICLNKEPKSAILHSQFSEHGETDQGLHLFLVALGLCMHEQALLTRDSVENEMENILEQVDRKLKLIKWRIQNWPVRKFLNIYFH